MGDGKIEKRELAVSHGRKPQPGNVSKRRNSPLSQLHTKPSQVPPMATVKIGTLLIRVKHLTPTHHRPTNPNMPKDTRQANQLTY